MTNDLQSFLDHGRRSIDEALARRVPSPGGTPPVLDEAVRYALLAPGKRMRGIVVLASCDVLRGDTERALPLACAIEMVHASSLVLDDLPSMDDATLRRGKPTLHRVVGEANAILAAVALLNGAFDEILGTAAYRPRVRLEMTRRLGRAIGAEGLIGGQVADLASTGQRLDLDALEYIHSHKTGALFIAAAEIGAVAAGARERDLRALHGYAKNLGLAFQITDDLLDYGGSSALTGKDSGSDRDKTTFVDLCGIEGSRHLVDDLIDAAVAALSSLGKKGRTLVALAEWIRTRDR